MTNSDSHSPPQAPEFFEFWDSVLKKHTDKLPGDTDWRQELESFWSGQTPLNTDEAEAFFGNIIGAAESYKEFSQNHHSSDIAKDRALPGSSAEKDLFNSIPRRLFEQHMRAAGIEPDNWGNLLKMLRDDPEPIKRYAGELQSFQQALAAYMDSFSKMTARAADRYKGRGRKEDAQAAFREWVDSFDEEYSDYIRHPDYPERYASVLNGSARLHQSFNDLVKPWKEASPLLGTEGERELLVENRQLKQENQRLCEEIKLLRDNLDSKN